MCQIHTLGGIEFEPIPYADPDCVFCGGDGIIDNRDVLVFNQSYFATCRCVDPADVREPAVFADDDADGWLDGVHRMQARYAGGKLSVEDTTEIVLHDVGRGRGIVIPRYFASMPDGRYASAHFVLHWPGSWRYALTQCVPLSRVAWHAGRVNSRSIGIEHDEPDMTDPHWAEGFNERSFELVDSIIELRPNIKRITAHRVYSPKTRTDPRWWPWEAWRERYEPLGIKVAA